MALSIPKPSLPPEYYVDNRVYTDPLCHRHEMERIFLRVWNFFCHDSELPQTGDFLTASVAGQRVLVCRNEAGALRGFYNTCRHRAAEVVPERCGNAKAFTCLYHHWTYNLDGELLGVPGEEAYQTSYNAGGLDRGTFGLVPVRVEIMHRLVFVCFDADAPPLADFLGSAADVLRHPFADPELEVSIVREQTMAGYWKMQPENSRDGYHAPLLHRRLRHVRAHPDRTASWRTVTRCSTSNSITKTDYGARPSIASCWSSPSSPGPIWRTRCPASSGMRPPTSSPCSPTR